MTFYDRPSALLDEPSYVDPDSVLGFETNNTVNFELLDSTRPERHRRWGSFGIGWAVQLVGIALIVWLTAALSTENKSPEQKEWVVKLTMPTLPEPRPRRVPRVIPLPKTTVAPPIETPEPPPKPKVPAVVAAAKPLPAPPSIKQPVAPPVLPKPNVPKWKPKVAVGAFNASPAPARVHLPSKVAVGAFNANPASARAHLPTGAVQTGGFGSPNGLPGQAQAGNPGNVPKLGTFELAEGPGNGNGSGGTRGARGAVASGGFGSMEAGPASGSGSLGRVEAGGFGDEGAGARKAAAPARPATVTSPLQPVEILSKPNPVYTQEARQLHIQGEVVLQVVFAATGELRVTRVVSGLGHGLDEAAVRAAREIRFKPARRNGQPVDFNATLRVLFQLAN